MNTKNRNDNVDGYDSLLEGMKGFAERMKGIADMAVVEYTPLVNDICSRKASQNEVGFCLIICSVFSTMNVCCNYSSTYAVTISIPIPA